MKSVELNALERVFSAEIEGRLPFQSKGKIYSDLCDGGYLQDMTLVYGAGERFPVTVTGYQLTHMGRMEYCATCRDVEEP